MPNAGDRSANARAKLAALCEEIEELRSVKRDSPRFKQWRMAVKILLQERFGEKHELSQQFSHLPFHKALPIYTNLTPMPSEQEHVERYRSDLTVARGIIDTALEMWDMLRLDEPAPATAPLVQLTNTNVANASASSTAMVEFPLDQLLRLVEQSGDLLPEQKERLKDRLEDLDGELRKPKPRWEKIRPAVKVLMDAGKEVAIKTLAAVVAKMAAGE